METDTSLLEEPGVESTYRDVDGVRLHVVAAGETEDPLVVLLHGFPDFWYGWHHQLVALADAGYRVLVPDQRGYNLSDAPEGLDAYRISRLSGDVRALIESEGRESAHVVAHDWGGGAAWDLALRHPETVDRLAILNSPHPSVFRETLQSNPRQLARSWYMLAFQLPVVPERVLGANHGARLATMLEGSGGSDTFEERDLARYRLAWEHNGVGPMLDWYRAAFRRAEDPPRETVSQPTLLCWGEDDVALTSSMAEASLAHCEQGHLEMVPGASHWVHIEERERVTDDLLAHLADGE
jgi:pimeloyl-ACP methyl ester carboxylesterase